MAEADLRAELVDRLELKMLVEACGVLDEGVAGAREIDLAMAAGAGIRPGPFARADERGLDEVLAALEGAAERWGPWFAPPALLRRLVAQGRLGRASGQGFFAYPRPDPGQDHEAVALETRGNVAVLWLDKPPANALGPGLVDELRRRWEEVEGRMRAVVVASSSPATFSAGADIKAFAAMDEAEAARLVEGVHALMASIATSSTIVIAAVNAAALGGGCELAMACDLRIAARSASFAQPEVNLGIVPGFGGTQRLPRLVGAGRAHELALFGDALDADEALRLGLVSEVVADHELFDAALAWARRAAEQSPEAVRQIKRVAHAALEDGLAEERAAFAAAFAAGDAREGFAAFREKRRARFG